MNFSRPLILGSNSPRRKFLLNEAGFSFKVLPSSADESFPLSLSPYQVPLFLARKKSDALLRHLNDEVVLTADTVVILDEKILNKPEDRRDAIRMLQTLSGRTHTVVTAVYMRSRDKDDDFSESSQVTFRALNTSDIEYYVDTFKPFDKAGAYGAQECLPQGMNPCSPDEIEFLHSVGRLDLIEKSMRGKDHRGIDAIERIDGSYFNVMGLPIHRVHDHLMNFRR